LKPDPLKILYVSQYFPPEACAPAVRVHGFARQWASQGHQVSVLTGFPNHPEGILDPEFRAQWLRGFSRENHQGVKVYRTWLYPAPNRGRWKRCGNYASFAVSASLAGPWITPRGGLVIGSSPQLLVAAAASTIARVRRLPFIFEVRDLWPQSLVGVGAAPEKSVLYRGLNRIANHLYVRADTIVVDGEWKRRQLVAAGISEGKLRIVRNGVSRDLIAGLKAQTDQRSRARIRREYGWSGRFVAMYAGTLGMAHGLETMLKAAAECKINPRILFVLIGEGAERERLQAKARELRLANVQFLPRQPHALMPGFLVAADAFLVLLRRAKVFQTAIPSKMFEAMAAAKPIVLGVEGEAKEILLKADAGLAVPPENARAVTVAVERLCGDGPLRERLGQNGKQSVEAIYLHQHQSRIYLDVMRETLARQQALHRSESSRLSTSTPWKSMSSFLLRRGSSRSCSRLSSSR